MSGTEPRMVRAVQGWRWMPGHSHVQQSFIVRAPEAELEAELARQCAATAALPGLLPTPSIIELPAEALSDDAPAPSLVDVLLAHLVPYGGHGVHVTCECGWETGTDDLRDWWVKHAEHVAQEAKAAGLMVLPAPRSDVMDRVIAEVARIDGRDEPFCVDCHDREVGVDATLVTELVAEVAQLRAEQERAMAEGDWA